MRKYKNDQSGLTLVEILASIVILVIMGSIITNIIVSSTKENKNQTVESNQISNAAYILKVITKDLRNTRSIESIDGQYKFLGDSISDSNEVIATYIFDRNNDALSKNGNTIVTNIKKFDIMLISDYEVQVSFSLNNKDYKTNIVLRKGDD